MSTTLFIYVFGIIGSIICFLPFLIFNKLDDISYYDRNISPIFISIKSIEYGYATMLCIGFALCTGNNFILDLVSSHSHVNQAYLQRSLIIFCLLVPDIFLVAYIIPYDRADLFGCLSAARALVYNVAGFSYLSEHGGIFFSSIWFLLLIAVSFINCMIRAIVSQSHDYAFEIVLLISEILVFVGLMWTIYSWQRSIKGNDIIENQFACTMYLIFTACLGVSFTVLYFGFSLRLDPDSSTTSLIAYRSVFLVFLICTSMLHARAHKAQLNNTQMVLERKRVFVRLVSHEIRTPLNIVITGLKLIEQELKYKDIDADVIDTLKDTQIASSMAVTLLDDILAYEKLEAGIMTLERVETCAWKFLRDSVRPFLVQARQCHIQLGFANEEALKEELRNIVIHIDVNKVNQVMRNLISNALKFTPVGGTVVVSARVILHKSCHTKSSRNTTTPFLRITVVDNGYGISKENLPRLFNEIIQFNAGVLQKGGGSGLGLWLSKSIMELHDGMIFAHSDGEGYGSTFSIELPIKKILETDNEIPLDIHSPSSVFVRPDFTPPPPMIYPQTSVPMNSSLNSYKTNKHAVIHPISESYPISNVIREENESYKDDPDIIHSFRHHSMSLSETKRTSIRTNYVYDDYLDCNNKQLSNKIDEKESENISIKQDNITERSPVSPNIDDNTVCRLLIVDDSALGRKMMHRAMKNKFHKINEAADGDSAVKYIQKALEENTLPQLIFMDHQMPIMDGATATREIRKLGYKGLIVGVTGNALQEDLDLFTASGLDKVIVKPYENDEIDMIIQDMTKRNGTT